MTWVNPLAKIGEAAVGFPSAGLPNSSSRNTFPASDVGSAGSAGLPVSPVPTYRVRSEANASRPPLCVAPRGIPVKIGFGTSPDAIRMIRLSCGVVTYA